MFDNPVVFARLGHVLLIVALLAATGTHWAMLQSVAWTTMLVDNLRAVPLREAVARTFDGKHPCKLCHEISKGKAAEKKTEFPALAKKLEFVSQRPVFVFSAPTHYRLAPDFSSVGTDRPHRPPVPPPRQLAA
ncbi:MAG: hypothetical protein KIS67_22575 [Verrucomicrobiae bacterium]|nr:hypothetical protein [Verrucomicrobiae bacterium]